jgi:hypothetical protein
MENMSFDDLGLLLGVIEIWVVSHILVHGLQFRCLMCHLHLLCELSHTLYFTLASNVKFVHVLT